MKLLLALFSLSMPGQSLTIPKETTSTSSGIVGLAVESLSSCSPFIASVSNNNRCFTFPVQTIGMIFYKQ